MELKEILKKKEAKLTKRQAWLRGSRNGQT